MRKVIVILWMMIPFNYALGQARLNEFSKWYVKTATGLNIPLSNLLSGEVSDNLIEYDDNSFYWQVISGNYFFTQKWGVEFTFQANASKSIHGRANRFNAAILKQYGENYFVNTTSGAQFDDFNIISGDFEKLYVGIVYRAEKQKYIILPRILIGVTSFYTDWGSTALKERGTNKILILSYSSGKRPNDHFTIAPALTFGYRLSNRMFVNLDLLYSYYKTNIEFVEETRDTFTENISYNTFDYKKNIHTLTTGIGLIFELKPATKTQ